MTNRGPIRAFSLVEVIIAAGVFAASVAVVISLLPALTRHSVEAQDALTALRLPDALKPELRRLAAAGGTEAMAAHVPVMGSPLDGGLGLVATRDASRLQARDYSPPVSGIISAGDQYFLIECWRFPDEPLRFDAQKHFFALAVRVSWPYRLPGASEPTAPGTRAQVMFTTSIVR